MPNVSSEDLIILLDSSRSMYRKENSLGGQSRIKVAIEAVKEIISLKKKEDASDRYAMVCFNGTIKQQNEMFFNEVDVLKFFRNEAEFSSGTSLGEALAAAIRIIVGEMRKIGEKTTRVIILSDGITLTSAMNPVSIAKIAKELGMIIDVIRFGPAKVPGNISKRLTELTHGDYFFVSDMTELQEAIDKTSQKKEKTAHTIFDKGNNGDSLSHELLSEIAGSLIKIDELTPDQKFKIFSMDPNKKLKCSICYANKCMMCETNFYGCGRFCPNCLTPVHLHCAMAWADNQKDSLNTDRHKIFRCVHCFYLLKIPIQNVSLTIDASKGGAKTAEKFALADAPSSIFNSVCADPECGIVFNEDEDDNVYKCNFCGSYFHDDCFETFHRKDHRCPYCKKVIKIV